MERDIRRFIKEYPNEWKSILKRAPYRLNINDSDDELMIVTYNSDSDFSHPVVRESRGIVYNKETMEVVSVGFDKFFNAGEPLADNIDWTTAVVTQKMDGSLVTLFWWNGKWNLKSNGALDASKVKSQSDPSKSFLDIFNEALKRQPLNWDALDHDVCYSFELLAPENRVIIQYEVPELVFILARNRITGEEIRYTQETNPTGIRLPDRYDLQSESDVRNMLDIIDRGGRKDVEGFVVEDDKCRRVKMKTKFYVDAHHLRGEKTLTIRNAIDIIRAGDIDEYLTYSPWQSKFMLDVDGKMKKLKRTLESIRAWVNIFTAECHTSDVIKMRKEFSEKCSSIDVPQCLMSFFYSAIDGKMDDLDSFFSKLTTSRIEGVISNGDFEAWPPERIPDDE